MQEGSRVRVTTSGDFFDFPGTVAQIVSVSDQPENVHVLFDEGYYWTDPESNIQHTDAWLEEKDVEILI